MEKEKNIIIMVKKDLKVNIYMENNGMVKVLMQIIIIILFINWKMEKVM